MILWRTISKELRGVRELLNLVQTEFLKLRRKKMIWFMLLAAFIMPFFSFVYYNYFEASGIDPVAFYKLAAFGYTPFIILPFVLGVFCVVLMHDENRYDMLKQLWIVPVSKMGYFFSKFIVVLIYSIVFMLISAVATVLFSVLPGFVAFEWQSVGFLAERCLEIGVLTAFAVMPILALAASKKGYIFPVCMTLLYVFLGFFITVNQYVPHSCVQHFRYHCKKRKYSGTCFRTEYQCPAGVVLYLYLGCAVCAVCCFFASQEKVR